ATYGFVVTDDGEKYFFHFGTCATKPEFFKVGDEVEFVLGEDSKTHRVHAQRLAKIRDPGDSSGSSLCNRLAGSAFTAVRSLKSCSGASKLTASACQSPVSSFNSGCRCPSTNVVAASTEPQQQQQMATEQYFFTNLAKPNPLHLHSMAGNAADMALEALKHLQQHSLVSVQCYGLVLSWPKFSEPDCAGTIACEIAGAPTLVKFNASSLKYHLETPLIFYGVKVNFTAIWHAG
uniref:CSD domain-containing protein n=1 Tax=Romanomermis culicivorax TaxID=13658 RepID=A0A915KGA6_ROMCU